MTVRILQIDVPEADHARVTDFWAATLSATPVDAPGAFVHLRDATSVLEVHVQSLADGPPGYHLDLEASDRDVEVARLVGLGARETDRFDGFTVLEDPAGQPFCVIDPDAAVPTPVVPRSGTLGYLDSVFFDVPAEHVDGEVAFWTEALGAGVAPRRAPDWPYFRFTGVHGPGGPLILEVQRIDEGAPRVHVDLTAPDIISEAARLEGLGARRIAEIQRWIVMADPVGNLFCIVPTRDGSPA